jgi:serine protease Do
MRRNLLLLSVVLAFTSSCNRTYTPASGGTEPRTMPGGNVKVSGPILSYADVVDRVAPAVVTVHSTMRVHAPQQFPFFNDPFFRQFFGGGVPQQPRSQVEEALGSGVIVRPDGDILTNHHVIDGAENITIDLGHNRTYKAKVVGSDAPSDLAVLKISANGLPVLQLADSDKVRVGDVCLAVGNPLGIGQTVTAGIVSAKGRATETGTGSFQDFLQTDAPINKGNSGGALVNTRGELIGINSQILSPNGGNIGIGFAIPSNMARNVMDQLMSKGKVQRGMLGVTIQQITPDLAQGLGLPTNKGVLVSGVTPGGPADKAGIKQGDVILQLNGHDVNSSNDLRNTVAAMAPGSDVTLTILRNGSQQTVQAHLVELNEQAARAAEENGSNGGEAGKLGITVVPMTPAIAQQLGVPRNTPGVAIQTVDPNGPAAQAGLQQGDIIQQVNRQPVRSAADVQNALKNSGNRPVLLLVNHGGQTIFVAVPVE